MISSQDLNLCQIIIPNKVPGGHELGEDTIQSIKLGDSVVKGTDQIISHPRPALSNFSVLMVTWGCSRTGSDSVGLGYS